MSTSSSDALHQKTVEELRFIEQNPSFYHPDLVRTASQELRRRGIGVAPLAPLDAGDMSYDEPAPTRRWGLVLLALGLLGLGGAGYMLGGSHTAPLTAAEKARAAAAADSALTLTTASSSPMPNYDAAVTACIAEQLAHVPAAEKKAPQELSQYRELSKRFWTAQTLSEHIWQKALAEPTNTLLPAQVELVQASWNDWRKAVVYGYKFGPVMADHYDRMSRVALQQQSDLRTLDRSLAMGGVPPSVAITERDDFKQDLLAGLVKVSPVTQKPYRVQVRHIRL